MKHCFLVGKGMSILASSVFSFLREVEDEGWLPTSQWALVQKVGHGPTQVGHNTPGGLWPTKHK